MRAVKIMLVVLVMIVVCSSAGAETFRFTASADNRPGESESGDNFDRWVYMLGQMAARVVDEGVFHIMPGDFDSPWITDTSLKYQFGSDVVWYPVVGNHETETPADMTWVRNNLPPFDNSGPTGSETTTYSWDYGNAHFVAINEYYDGSSDTGTNGDVVDALYNWLVDDLDNNTKPVVFVIGHEPAYPVGAHVGDSLDGHPPNRDRFWKLLNDRKVIAYLCGHTHYYSALQQAQTGAYPCDAFTWQIDCGNAGNPRELEQTFIDVTVTDTEVRFKTWQGLINSSYTITDHWTVLIPAPIVKAHNPSPAYGATQVAVDADLGWTAGAGAVSHNVYFGNPLTFKINQLGTTFDPGPLDYDTTYSWRIDEVGPDGMVPGDVWSFRTQPSHFDDLANSDIPVRGTIAGNYTDTQSSDDVCEEITERLSGGKPSNRYSYLEHKWTFNVSGGNFVTFNVEAYKTNNGDGDSFILAYSTDDYNYNDLVTVSKTSDDNTVQSWPLPASTTGTVYIRVKDTNQIPGSQSLDTISIDCMYIRSSGEGEPDDNDPPTPNPMTWNIEPHATGSTSISMTATMASDPSGVEYFFECTSGNGHNSGWQDSPYYQDTGLTYSTEYGYRVQARDKSPEPGPNYTDWSVETSDFTMPEAGDLVTITKAEYRLSNSELNVEATSDSGGTAELRVYDSGSDTEYGVMDYDRKKNIYRLKRRGVSEPVGQIWVISSLNGFDFMNVTPK